MIVAVSAVAVVSVVRGEEPQSWLDLANYGLSLHASLISAGLEACSEHHPQSGAKARAAYEKVRSENLEIFTRLELSEAYLSNLMRERAQIAAAPKRELDEYCPEQLTFIAELEDLVGKLRKVHNP